MPDEHYEVRLSTSTSEYLLGLPDATYARATSLLELLGSNPWYGRMYDPDYESSKPPVPLSPRRSPQNLRRVLLLCRGRASAGGRPTCLRRPIGPSWKVCWSARLRPLTRRRNHIIASLQTGNADVLRVRIAQTGAPVSRSRKRVRCRRGKSRREGRQGCDSRGWVQSYASISRRFSEVKPKTIWSTRGTWDATSKVYTREVSRTPRCPLRHIGLVPQCSDGTVRCGTRVPLEAPRTWRATPARSSMPKTPPGIL